MISRNGKVEKAKWEYLGNNSILIDQKDTSHLFKQGFFDENVLVLKVGSKEEYAFLVNENRYNGEINSMERATDFLRVKYLNAPPQQLLTNEITSQTVNAKIVEESNQWIDTICCRAHLDYFFSCIDFLQQFKVKRQIQVQSYFFSLHGIKREF